MSSNPPLQDPLRNNQDTFFNLIENAPFGIYVVDSQFRLVQVSAGAQRVFNNIHPLIGRDFAEILRILWPEPFASEAIAHFRHTLETGESYAAPNTTQKRQNISEVESYDWKIDRINLSDGEFGVVCYFYDMTERKQAEEALRASEEALRASEERFRKMAEERQKFVFLADESTDFIGMCDMDSKPFYVNKAGLNLVGLDTMEEACRTLVPDFLFPEDQPFIVKEFLPKVIRDGQGELEIRFRHFKTGQAIWMSFSVCFMKSTDGEPIGLATISRDITERKRAEEDIKKYSQELESSNKSLEQFAYVASHDLQEPLRIVSSYAELLKLKYSDKLDEKGQQFTDYIGENVSKMQSLIRDLLMYSQVGREKKFQEVDIEAVFKQAVKNLSIMIKESAAEVTCDPLPRMTGSEALMTQLFQNLINNAIKFRNLKTPPKVHISAKKEEENWVFSVKDNGIGISSENHSRIFEIFKRLHSQSEYPGTGIGLALCKKIVEFHEGKIWIESEYGKGTTFYFSLPSKAQ